MKRIFIILFVVLIAVSFIGCEESADTKQAQETKSFMAEAHRIVGFPAMKNWKELKDLKMLYELRDREDLICYAYIKSDYQGKLVFIGKCIGYGLPYSVQFSNPEREVYRAGYSHKLPQPEPNGLFMPSGLSATWLMMIDAKGKAKPVYIEPEIVVSPFRLQ